LFGRHVKLLVPAAIAVVITLQPALGPRGGLWPVPLLIHKEGLCSSIGDINRLMMIQIFVYMDDVFIFSVYSFEANAGGNSARERDLFAILGQLPTGHAASATTT
jgi:hypothetical protein